MSVYDEMSVIGLKAFAKMLDIEITEDPNHEEIALTSLRIKNALDNGAIVTQTVNGFTPLMLYATYHVLDNRFSEQLQDENKIIASTSLRGNNMSSSRRVNALSCAVSTKNLEAIEQLLATNKFVDKQNYDVALELTALLNLSEAIPLFAAKGCNLFTSDFFTMMTPLMFACVIGNVEVARQIMLTNPHDQQLNLTSLHGESAISLALKNGNEKLISLLSSSISHQRQLLMDAIKAHDLKKIKEILKDSPRQNLILFTTHGNYVSILAEVYSYPDNSFRDDCITELERHLQSYTSQDKIPVLIITYSQLIEKNQQAAKKYLEQLQIQISRLSTQFTKLVIPMDGFGYDLSEELWCILQEIIHKNNIREIDFSGICPSFYDPFGEDFNNVCTVNFASRRVASFISTLINNTSVIDCKLYRPTVDKPLTQIVELVCERNKKINLCSTAMMKDKIFNHYVESINELIGQYKQDERIEQEGRSQIELISKKSSVYSLSELTAYTIYKSPDSNKRPSLPEPCELLIQDMIKYPF